MSLQHWNTICNGQEVSVCRNSWGKEFYLYETEVIGRRVYAWVAQEPGQQEERLKPITLPSGFRVEETERQRQPFLVRE